MNSKAICQFCFHGFITNDSRRRFCYDCLPAHRSIPDREYMRRYFLLRAAVGDPAAQVATSSRIPRGHPAYPPPLRKSHIRVSKPCAFCGEMFAGKTNARYCSTNCQQRNARKAGRIRSGEAQVRPVPVANEPVVIAVTPKPQRKSRHIRELVATMPSVGTCVRCSGDLRPWWTLYANTKAKRQCYECYLLGHRERNRQKPRVQSQARRVPSGAIVECVVCGTVFQRSRQRAACSPACSEELRLAKDRRQRARRRGAARGDLYTLRSVYDASDGVCQLCNLPVDLELSGMDPNGATVDHIVPLSRGGIDCASNVQLAHRRCNSIRGAKELVTT